MIQLTMAILSTGSAECIAVSSLLSYDIYRTYFNPEASGGQILFVSRIFVCLWALVMAISSIVLNEMDVGLGYVYNFMATALGSAVVPIACSIYTDKLDSVFAIASAIIGMIAAIVAWMAQASTYDGGITFDNTGELHAQLAGGLVALLASAFVCIIGCIFKPMNFDWKILQDGVKLVGGDGGENANVLGDDVDGTPEALEAAKQHIDSEKTLRAARELEIERMNKEFDHVKSGMEKGFLSLTKQLNPADAFKHAEVEFGKQRQHLQDRVMKVETSKLQAIFNLYLESEGIKSIFLEK